MGLQKRDPSECPSAKFCVEAGLKAMQDPHIVYVIHYIQFNICHIYIHNPIYHIRMRFSRGGSQIITGAFRHSAEPTCRTLGVCSGTRFLALLGVRTTLFETINKNLPSRSLEVSEDRVGIRILQSMASGIPLSLGLGNRM